MVSRGSAPTFAHEKVDLVVDATHPFSEQMSRHAELACRAESVDLLRLERPGWSQAPDAAAWHWVADDASAAAAAADLGARPFLTVGRQRLDQYVPALGGHDALVRVVDQPDVTLPVRLDVCPEPGSLRPGR